MKKILIIGPSWVGDTVMAQTLFKALKHQYNNNVTIDVVAPSWSALVLARMPEVNTSFELPIPHGKFALRQRYELGVKLRANNYDQAIVLPNSWKSALVPVFAGIKQRTGFCGELRFGLLNDLRYLDKQRYPLMVQRFVALAYPANYNQQLVIQNPTLRSDPAHALAAISRLNAEFAFAINTNSKILAICAGAAFGPAKCWPSDYYSELVNAKVAAGWQVWLFGSNADKAITDTIYNATQDKEHVINLAGTINLLETIDLLSMTTAVISNDSGLMHIAAALDKPVIAIYGSTTPTFTPPLSNKAVILEKTLECRPCFKRECPFGHYLCLKNITVNEVLASLQRLCA